MYDDGSSSSHNYGSSQAADAERFMVRDIGLGGIRLVQGSKSFLAVNCLSLQGLLTLPETHVLTSVDMQQMLGEHLSIYHNQPQAVAEGISILSTVNVVDVNLEPQLNIVTGFRESQVIDLLRHFNLRLYHGVVVDPSEPLFWHLDKLETWSHLDKDIKYGPRSELYDGALALYSTLTKAQGLTSTAYYTLQSSPGMQPFSLVYNPVTRFFEVLHMRNNRLYFLHANRLDSTGLIMFEDCEPLISEQSRIFCDKHFNILRWEMIDDLYIVEENNIEQSDRDLAMAYALADMDERSPTNTGARYATTITSLDSCSTPNHLDESRTSPSSSTTKDKKSSRWKNIKVKLGMSKPKEHFEVVERGMTGVDTSAIRPPTQASVSPNATAPSVDNSHHR